MSDVSKRLFPSGGMSQSTWSDLRILLDNNLSGFVPIVSRVAEIGIIDLNKVVKK